MSYREFWAQCPAVEIDDRKLTVNRQWAYRVAPRNVVESEDLGETPEEIGWRPPISEQPLNTVGKRPRNGRLLTAAEENGFDVLLTGDVTTPDENAIAGRRIGLVLMSANHWPIVREHVPAIAEVLHKCNLGRRFKSSVVSSGGGKPINPLCKGDPDQDASDVVFLTDSPASTCAGSSVPQPPVVSNTFTEQRGDVPVSMQDSHDLKWPCLGSVNDQIRIDREKKTGEEVRSGAAVATPWKFCKYVNLPRIAASLCPRFARCFRASGNPRY